MRAGSVELITTIPRHERTVPSTIMFNNIEINMTMPKILLQSTGQQYNGQKRTMFGGF